MLTKEDCSYDVFTQIRIQLAHVPVFFIGLLLSEKLFLATVSEFVYVITEQEKL